ncbi:hypothetical protein BO78DRAFT_387899 [Aspergillus sclerotiicarbonarius CBS 121057]|uniref:Glycine zipper 2TM domain-containing protein n=1 Tax=Aspergillus sclerotiicarbonarius (strain CBS 121057 / IBT 28362) TaxID=1448318 RepID=A0A319EFD9_ASPSB|nr:hypothetical protein BO78DRAFT_387899 [Aspergillus sclerotiicarbonarius CBS 121057]
MSDRQHQNPYYGLPDNGYRPQYNYGAPPPPSQRNLPIIQEPQYPMNPPGCNQGSSADYYTSDRLNHSQTAPLPQETGISPDEAGSERSLGGSILGGASGYYLGHKKGHGVLGAVGGGLLGNYLGDRMDDRKQQEYYGRRYEYHEHHHHCHNHCGLGFHCDCVKH